MKSNDEYAWATERADVEYGNESKAVVKMCRVLGAGQQTTNIHRCEINVN